MTHTTKTLSLLSLITIAAMACGDTAVAERIDAGSPPRGFAKKKSSATSAQEAVQIEKAVIEFEDETIITATVEPSLFDLEAIVNDGDIDHVFEGERYLEEGKSGEAVTAFRKALYLSKSASAFKNLGAAYEKNGEVERAVECLEEAVKMNGYLFDTRLKLSKHHASQGNTSKAIAHARHVAINRIDDVEANTHVAKLYLKAQMFQQAITALERVVDVAPDNKHIRNNLGFAALQIGENAKALSHLERTLDLEPSAYMMNNLGIAYERDGREEESLAAFMRADELQSPYVKARVNIARMQETLDDESQEMAKEILGEYRKQSKSKAVALLDEIDVSE